MQSRWRRKCLHRQQTRQQGNRLSGAGLGIAAALVCILLSRWLSYRQTLISGYVRVIDGDSLEVDGNAVRLRGIDAPEWGQTCRSSRGRNYRCGEASARELKRLVQFRKVLCKRTGIDRYGRFVGACWAQPILWGAPVDLSAAMVASGHAEVYRHFKGKGLADLLDRQAKAKQLKLGVWQGSFQAPQDWRNDHKHPHA